MRVRGNEPPGNLLIFVHSGFFLSIFRKIFQHIEKTMKKKNLALRAIRKRKIIIYNISKTYVFLEKNVFFYQFLEKNGKF